MTNSVIGSGVVIEEGAVVKDSIIMQDSVIGKGAVVEKSIIAEDVKVGAGAHLGVGEYAPSKYDQKVYQFDLVTVGEHSVIPERSARIQQFQARRLRKIIRMASLRVAATL